MRQFSIYDCYLVIPRKRNASLNLISLVYNSFIESKIQKVCNFSYEHCSMSWNAYGHFIWTCGLKLMTGHFALMGETLSEMTILQLNRSYKPL